MKQRALFLDRDGVVNEENGFVHTVEEFSFRAGLFDFLTMAQDNGYKLIIVTNQSGIARGLYGEEEFKALTAWMLRQFSSKGISIAGVMHCSELKDAPVQRYARASYWRKPNPGMILEAAAKYGIDLPRSAMIGDRLADMQAAAQCGITNLFLMEGQFASLSDAVAPVLYVRLFDEVAGHLNLLR